MASFADTLEKSWQKHLNDTEKKYGKYSTEYFNAQRQYQAERSGTDSGNWFTNLWDKFLNGNSNDVAMRQHEDNMAFQNMQFQYQQELNQLQLEREDTAFQRQAKDAQAIGINPMALASGSGASSSPFNSTSFSGSSNPSLPNGFASIVGLFSQLVDMNNQISNGSAQRDLLAEQADMQRLQNIVYASENGLMPNGKHEWKFNPDFKPLEKRPFQEAELKNANATANRNERVNNYQEKNNINDETNMLIRGLIDVIEQGKPNEDKTSLFSRVKTMYENYIKDHPRIPSASDSKEEAIRKRQRKYYIEKINKLKK